MHNTAAAILLAAVAALASQCAHAQGASLAPDTVGLMAYTYHTNPAAGLTNDTPGVLLSWKAPTLPWADGAIDLAIYRNSQRHPGLYIGVSKEWQLRPRLFVGIGAGAVWGYRYLGDEFQRQGMSTAKALLCWPGPDGRMCQYEKAGNPQWAPALQLRARYALTPTLSVSATYLPAKLLGRHTDKTSDAISLWLIKEF